MVGENLTQLDENEIDRVTAICLKKLSLAERDYTASDRGLLVLNYFLLHFRKHL